MIRYRWVIALAASVCELCLLLPTPMRVQGGASRVAAAALNIRRAAHHLDRAEYSRADPTLNDAARWWRINGRPGRQPGLDCLAVDYWVSAGLPPDS